MEQAGIGDIRLIILGVARRPTAYAASTGRAAAGLVGLGCSVFAKGFIFPFFQIICNQITGTTIKILVSRKTHTNSNHRECIRAGSAVPSLLQEKEEGRYREMKMCNRSKFHKCVLHT